MLLHERKFLAALIDISVVLILTLVIFLIVPKIDYAKSLAFFVIYAFVAFSYFFLYFLISKDSTLGLHIMNLKVLNKDWSKPSKKVILLRSLSYCVPVTYVLNLLYVYINRGEVTFFDEVSDSFVALVGDTYNVNTLK